MLYLGQSLQRGFLIKKILCEQVKLRKKRHASQPLHAFFNLFR